MSKLYVTNFIEFKKIQPEVSRHLVFIRTLGVPWGLCLHLINWKSIEDTKMSKPDHQPLPILSSTRNLAYTTLAPTKSIASTTNPVPPSNWPMPCHKCCPHNATHNYILRQSLETFGITQKDPNSLCPWAEPRILLWEAKVKLSY